MLERERVGADAHNDAVYERRRTEVGGVLVCPVDPADSSEGFRPDGAIVAYELHFPKSYAGDLYGARVEVRGKPFRVVGRPLRYTAENVPGKWNMRARVEEVDG